MSRKFVSTIVLMMLFVPIVAFSIRPARSANVFSQNFDDEVTASVPQGWTVQNPNICSLTVNDSVHFGSSGKSARYEDTVASPTGYAYVGRTFEAQSGSLVLSFAMMAESPNYFHVYIDDGDWHHAANIYFLPDLTFAYYDDSGYHRFGSFSVNTWYKINMAIDVPTNTYDIYIDDILKVQAARFRGFSHATQLHRFIFNLNSWETNSGYIDEISLVTIQRTTPIATQITLTGSLDYLIDEDVNVRLAALVKDVKTMVPVPNANVTIEIYYPNGSLFVSDPMQERLAGTGIYEWESIGTIREMRLGKGVYLAYAKASIHDDLPSSDILVFHVDPPAETQPFQPMQVFYYVLLAGGLIMAAIAGVSLLKRYRKIPLKTSTDATGRAR